MSNIDLKNGGNLDFEQDTLDMMDRNIAEMGADQSIRYLVTTLNEANTNILLRDLNGFSAKVRNGEISKAEVLGQLQIIAKKTFEHLNTLDDDDFERNGSDYAKTRISLIKHFRIIAKNFGVQIQISSFLDTWSKNNPRLNKAQKQALKEQEAKASAVEAADKSARVATKTAFEEISGELFKSEHRVRGRAVSEIADIINEEIRTRVRSGDARYASYKALTYYWPQNRKNSDEITGDLAVLRQDLMYLAHKKWGSAVNSENAKGHLQKATQRIEGNPTYFDSPASSSVNVTSSTDDVIQTAGKVGAQIQAAAAPSQQQARVIVDPFANPGAKTATMEAVSAITGPSSRVSPDSPRTAFFPDAPPSPSSTTNTQLTPAEIAAIEKAQRSAKTIPPAKKPSSPLKNAEKKPSSSLGNWFQRNVRTIALAAGFVTLSGAGYYVSQHSNSIDGSASLANAPQTTPVTSSVNTVSSSTVSSAQVTPSVSASTIASAKVAAVDQSPSKNPGGSVEKEAHHVEPAPAVPIVGISYDLGEAQKAAVPTKGVLTSAEASVDGTPFSPQILRADSWYQTQQTNASHLLSIYDADSSRLDSNTVDFVRSHEGILRDLASQTDFNGVNFKKNFEQKHGAAKLFAAKGVYNVLLAFDHVLDLYSGNFTRLSQDKTPITLKIGNKYTAAEQRYAVATYDVPAQHGGNPPPASEGGVPGGDNNQPGDQGGGGHLNQLIPDTQAPGIDMVPVNTVPDSRFGMNGPQAPAQTVDHKAKETATQSPEEMHAVADLNRLAQEVNEAYAAEKKKESADLANMRAQIEQNYALEQIDAAWDTIASAHDEVAQRKAVLKAQLDSKVAKLFARGKEAIRERGPLPELCIKKDYHVGPEHKSIRSLLDLQISASNLSKEAKDKAHTAVLDMIRSNGSFIEKFKLHPNGSRDITLRDEWIDKINEAAGVKLAVLTEADEVHDTEDGTIELTDDDIIEVIDHNAKRSA